MDVLKICIKTILIFSFGYLAACKPKVPTNKSKTQPITKTVDSVITYPKYITKNYVLGKFNYKTDVNFSKVSEELASKNIYVRKETLAAFKEMYKQAKKEGVYFKIISGTRNFAHQKRIWDYKWNEKFKHYKKPKERALKILEYSSMPSTSRHHWGTDIDINNLNNSYFEKGTGKKEYEWLLKNAPKYGFYQVYTSKENGRTGYNEEKWHWSYTPLSSLYLKYYNLHNTHKDITGFEGNEYASEIDMIRNYVNGINPEILNYKH